MLPPSILAGCELYVVAVSLSADSPCREFQLGVQQRCPKNPDGSKRPSLCLSQARLVLVSVLCPSPRDIGGNPNKS